MLRVGLAFSSEVVSSGLAVLLGETDDRAVLVPEADRVPGGVDVVLVDLQGGGTSVPKRVRELVDAGFAEVVTFGDEPGPGQREQLLSAGARAHVPLRLDATGLVTELRTLLTTPTGRRPSDGEALPGFDAGGLTVREAQILRLICRGMSNAEIATELFLGINTVKTYIRATYRKIGATTRVQAVLWGMRHGG